MPDNLSCSADSFRFEIAISEKQIAPFSVHGSQCFVFTVHSVWCSRDFHVATFQPGLAANQKPCNVSHHIAPAGLWRTCHEKNHRQPSSDATRDGAPSPVSWRPHISHRKTGRFHHELFLSTTAILSSLVPLRDFRTSRILSNSLCSRVSKMCWKFALPCSSFNSKFSCLVLMEPM